MKGTEELRQALADFLTAENIPTLCAWPDQPRSAKSPSAVVSLKHIEGVSPGFQDYLGEKFDENLDQWVELYGKRVRMVFGVDLYGSSAHEVGRILDQVAELLGSGRPGGLKLLEFSAGETEYKSEHRRYVCPARAVFEAWAFGKAREDGTFLEFKVRGDMRG